MDPNTFIPTPDPIPAPSWFFIILEQLLFLLHIIVINAVLGGALILLFKRIFKKEDAEIDRSVAFRLPTLIALGINFGVAPLLFIQVVFGNLFFTSSVLMAVYWILIIPLLIIAYYGLYINYNSLSPLFMHVSLVIASVIILYIGFMFVNNNSLMEQPEKWSAYLENRGGTILNISDPIFLPRYLHFIAASVAIGGLLYAIVLNVKQKKDKSVDQQKIINSLKIFAIATSIQVIIGFWFLLSVPSEFIMNFMGKDLFSTIVLLAGIAGGIGAIVFGFLGKLNAAVIHALLTLIAMVITRYNLRMMYLSDNFQLSSLTLEPQYIILVLFLIILVAGLGSVFYMLKISSVKAERRAAQ